VGFYYDWVRTQPDRLEGKWIDLLAEVFAGYKVAALAAPGKMRKRELKSRL